MCSFRLVSYLRYQPRYQGDLCYLGYGSLRHLPQYVGHLRYLQVDKRSIQFRMQSVH